MRLLIALCEWIPCVWDMKGQWPQDEILWNYPEPMIPNLVNILHHLLCLMSRQF